MNGIFRKLAQRTSAIMGSAKAFFIALLIILAWILSGPYFDYSDTWQLVINTATTIVTFLMVFLIQNTQNRDNKALQLKLDELIRAIRSARNDMIDIEAKSDEELDKVAEQFTKIAEKNGQIRK